MWEPPIEGLRREHREDGPGQVEGCELGGHWDDGLGTRTLAWRQEAVEEEVGRGLRGEGGAPHHRSQAPPQHAQRIDGPGFREGIWWTNARGRRPTYELLQPVGVEGAGQRVQAGEIAVGDRPVVRVVRVCATR